ncbi:NAD-dependent DNA ligase LigA [Blattabacterium punctulatus]|uniref:NAD-dependent DNA ligase LigA n=1 Tax=Blattabacterium punctulatus TaxID=164514 RepID=UPI000D7CAFEF|nr:NAD-dependent DNA ligase LigA [Blattabacterium punctulatus]AWU44566.1 DNA ligase (NAD(+)) LigA [Blattabacterium punctulatus]
MNNKKKYIKEKIYKLRKELSEYNYQYYILDTYNVSDYEFDKKLRELYLLEKKNPEFYDPKSPTIRIGGRIHPKKYGSTIIHHKYKMYSLQNTYSKSELMIWKNRIDQSISFYSFVCELKYDGVSINLIYKNGLLTNAVTRGDGKKGENVTKNVRTIKSIPIKLIGETYPRYLEIRGEIFISKKKFIEINIKRKKKGIIPYSNPRNTASGTLKIKDSKEVSKRNLSCIVYTVIGKNLPFDTQYQSFKYLRNWGFQVPETAMLCKTKKDIFHFMDYWNLWKNHLPYHIDGIVIKVNEYQKQYLLGFTNKYPRWAISYKFRQILSETKLLNIKFQVGRTGIITPVAYVRPTNISGTMVKKVSLYNDRFIQKMDLHYGDYIFLEKGGDVIPKVTKINVKKRLINANPIYFLKKCPSCESYLIKKNKLLYCSNNNNCPSQRIGKIQHFVSIQAMNIQGIGNKMIKKLYKKGFLYKISDLYRLKKEEFLQLKGVKEKLTDNIIKNIEKSKYNSYYRVLYGLGIPHVGEYISKKLTETFTDINYLINADYNILTSISGIGKKIAKSISTYFSIMENKKMVEKLIKYGLNFSKKKYSIMEGKSMIEGKSFVFTGKLSCMSRNIAKNMVEILGGKVFSTVTNQINFIVVGKNFGSKLEKGMKKNNVKILTEDIFIELLKKENKEK